MPGHVRQLVAALGSALSSVRCGGCGGSSAPYMEFARTRSRQAALADGDPLRECGSEGYGLVRM